MSDSQSWCQTPSGANDQVLLLLYVVLLMWGALSDERTGLPFVVVIVSSTYHLYLQFYLSALYIVICQEFSDL
jgi:hypothetical protein